MKGEHWCFCGMFCTGAFISVQPVLLAVRFSQLYGTRFGNHLSVSFSKVWLSAICGGAKY